MFASRFPELVLHACSERNLAANQGKQTHTNVIMEYCLAGSGVLHINGTAFPLEAGNCFVIPTNSAYTLTSPSPETWHSIMLEVSGTQLSYLLPQIGASKTTPVLPWCGDPIIERHFVLIHQQKEDTRLSGQIGLLSALYGLFGGLLVLNVDPLFRRPLEWSNDPIAAIISYIKNNHSKNLTVTELADRLHLSRSYFFTLFKQRTGMSPQQFLVRHRLWLACRKLEQHPGRITMVANAVGYEATVFTQAFRRTLGISPTKFCTLPHEEREALMHNLGIQNLISEPKA